MNQGTGGPGNGTAPGEETPATPMHLTLLGLPGASLGNLVAVMEVLTIANQLRQHRGLPAAFTWSLATPGAEEVGNLGITLAPDHAMEDSLATDLVFTPAFIGRVEKALEGRDRVCAWLRDRHRQGVPLATSCTGSFLLAHAGLLDGRRAATNWIFASTFRRLFPRVRLDENAVLVHDKGISTAGATSAVNHFLVQLVATACGGELAATVGGLLLAEPTRTSQAPYRRGLPAISHGDREIAAVQHWLHENWRSGAGLTDLARRAALGERQFLRRFKKATGLTPVRYQQSLRLEEARRFLETGNMAVGDVTLAVGYEDVATFRRLFQRSLGMSPNEYRRRFGRPAAL